MYMYIYIYIYIYIYVCKIVVVESNSRDNSKALLREWQAKAGGMGGGLVSRYVVIIISIIVII